MTKYKVKKYLDATPEHSMYNTYIFWKDNSDKIKKRIKLTFELDYNI